MTKSLSEEQLNMVLRSQKQESIFNNLHKLVWSIFHSYLLIQVPAARTGTDGSGNLWVDLLGLIQSITGAFFLNICEKAGARFSSSLWLEQAEPLSRSVLSFKTEGQPENIPIIKTMHTENFPYKEVMPVLTDLEMTWSSVHWMVLGVLQKQRPHN